MNKKAKIVMVGSVATGKSSILMKYVNREFKETFSTTGAMFYKKYVKIDEKECNLSIWDTAGQEQFKAVSKMYYRNANVFLLVFDLSRTSTLQECEDWLQSIKDNCTEEYYKVILVGNKADLEFEQSILQEAQLFAQNYKLQFFESSCKTGLNVDEVFTVAVKYVMTEVQANNQKTKNNQIISNLNQQLIPNNNKCCK